MRGSVAGRACVNGRACTGLCGVMGMTVEKVINNNVISALENGREVVVMGRGIGFQIRAGMEIPKDQIEKVFRLENAAGASADFCRSDPVRERRYGQKIKS